MNCLWKILHIICFYLVLGEKYSSIGAIPIVGPEPGVELATIDELLFIVSISRNTSSNLGKEELNHICGGALITHKHVLTAAHCFQIGVQYSDIVVKIGSNNLRYARAHAIDWWKTYNKWANIATPHFFSYYNIAIIKLRDVASSDISLPMIKYSVPNLFIGKTVISGGWGRIKNYKIPMHKRIGKFYVVPQQKCIYPMDTLYFCTTAPHARLAYGDVGGPLLSLDRKSIVGINTAAGREEGVYRLINAHISINFAKQFINQVTKL